MGGVGEVSGRWNHSHRKVNLSSGHRWASFLLLHPALEGDDVLLSCHGSSLLIGALSEDRSCFVAVAVVVEKARKKGSKFDD